MNAARKLIAFIRDSAAGVSAQLEHPENTVGDLTDARRTVAHMRADLVELDQRLHAEIVRRIARPNPALPLPQCTMREVDAYQRRLEAGTSCVVPATIHEPAEPFRGVEQPVGRPLAGAPVRRAPGRYGLDYRTMSLVGISGTISSPGRKAV